MSENRKAPWRMFLPFLLVVALLGAWSAYWFFAVAAAKSFAQTQRASLAAQGFTLACAKETWGGYPFRFEFTCQTPLISFPKGASVALSSFEVIAQAYDPMHAVVLADGPTTVTEANGTAHFIRHGQALASIVAALKQQPRITAEIPNASTDDGLAIAMLRIASRPADGGNIDVAVTGEKLLFTQAGKPTLTADESQLLGVFDPHTDRLAISDVHATAGGLKVSGTGNVGVDAARMPNGTLNLQTNDPQGLLALAEPYEALTPEQKQGVLAFLVVMGNKIQVTAKEGKLYIGPVSVTDLRPLF
ncbi:DUF2125 domain-containing protein [Aestuariivirga sp.]|uniref:DUF2125 domain-containing protein n=1 Tax=Aestuariivirga sp. TaxID=2650926 RepID=UPI0039E620F4